MSYTTFTKECVRFANHGADIEMDVRATNTGSAWGVACSLKHFFANNAEYLRNSNHSIMTERTARELCLKIFEVALQVSICRTP